MEVSHLTDADLITMGLDSPLALAKELAKRLVEALDTLEDALGEDE